MIKKFHDITFELNEFDEKKTSDSIVLYLEYRITVIGNGDSNWWLWNMAYQKRYYSIHL
jgi:hypothetical protein